MEDFTLNTSMGVWEYGSKGVKHSLTETLINNSYYFTFYYKCSCTVFHSHTPILPYSHTFVNLPP
jgi:hypothetical protein